MSIEDHLRELAEATRQIAAQYPAALTHVLPRLADPLAVDQFGLQCQAISDALALVASRAHGLAETLLDESEEE